MDSNRNIVKEEDEYTDASDVDDNGEVMDAPHGEKKKRKSAAGDIDQLVLLCVDHVCTKQGISIPWDLVGKEINDTLTGEAIKQHLVKVRKARETHGQQVPPKLAVSERRRPFSDYPPMTPIKGRDTKTTSEENTSELPLRNLLHLPSKKTASSISGSKKGLSTSNPRRSTLETNNSTLLQHLKNSGTAPRAMEQKSSGRGSKRARSSKKGIKQEDSDSEFNSLSKKVKMTGQGTKSQSTDGIKLRDFTRKNYTEPPLDDDVFFSKPDVPKAAGLVNQNTMKTPTLPTTTVPTSTSAPTNIGKQIQARIIIFTPTDMISDYSDVRDVFNGAVNEWNISSPPSMSRSQNPSGTQTMPGQEFSNHEMSYLDQGYGSEPYQPSLDGNYLWMRGRDNAHHSLERSYNGNDNPGVHVYTNSTEANSATGLLDVGNTFPGSSRVSPSTQTFNLRGSVTPTNANFADFNKFRSSESSDTSDSTGFTKANNVFNHETGNIFIGNGTGRGNTTLTPTAMTFDHEMDNRHLGGLPQTYNMAGGPPINFTGPARAGIQIDTGIQSDVMDYYSGNTQGLSGHMTQGMNNLGLSSGPVNHSQSFGSAYGSFNNGNTQDSGLSHSSYTSGAFNASAYEQHHDSDAVFSGSFVNMYGDLE
nr:hypothetical protein CFP56_33733 [Quercus suber]